MPRKTAEEKAQEAEEKARKEAKAEAEKLTRPTAGKKGNVPALQINIGDPFIDGTIRAYKTAGGKADANARPFVLLASDPAAAATLQNYKLRCGGACDSVRLAEAEKAIAAFEEFAKKS